MKRIIILITFSLLVLVAHAEVKKVQYRGLWYAVDTELQEAQFLRQPDKIKGNLAIADSIKYKNKATGRYVKVAVVSIAESALMGQKKIKALYIPATIVEIGDNAFANCRRLRYVYFASAQMGAKAGRMNWFAGTRADIHFDLMPGESVSLE